jgi:hypothetical protein
MGDLITDMSQGPGGDDCKQRAWRHVPIKISRFGLFGSFKQKQTVEKDSLAFQNPLTCLGNIEPGSAVELGERLRPSGARRPFHFENVAFEIVGIPVIFNCPDMHALSSGLFRFAE